MLHFDQRWRLLSPGPISKEVQDELYGIIMKVALHGYLSAPKGGGVRHGADLKAGVAMQANEARLFCNLIRSYIDFPLAEYDRFKEAVYP
jgi:hypothetical protein